MPIVTVSMYTGRTQRDKDRLAEAITEDAVNILKVDIFLSFSILICTPCCFS
jgi:phenylpyruvate tautomerase PptA (4-oxalocrotonate tautomerase family)